MPTPPQTMALTQDALYAGFLRGAPAARWGSVFTTDDGALVANGETIARRVDATSVWLVPTRVSRAAAARRRAFKRHALLAGYQIHTGAKPPIPAPGVAPVPPVSPADAGLVAEALEAYAGLLPEPTHPRSLAARCRRLAAVYEAARVGDRALAVGLYAALPPSPEEE